MKPDKIVYDYETYIKMNNFTPISGVVEELNLIYIEQVTFRAPYNLTLIGSDDTRLGIFLKQKGLPNI